MKIGKKLQIINDRNGFTLIELLVVISILGILLAISIFGMQGARQASRDGKRKADLEQMRSGLEIYRADCNIYPNAMPATGAQLKGSGTPSTCAVANVYISSVPADPVPSTHSYTYSSNGSTYEICASMEQGGTTVTCGGSSSCGGSTCNYKVVSP
ncbi:hypothetical protein A2434_00620 [Candidatus Woesebacteria bacterium RIFOXYC1_FULL_41_14]|uniref:Type II secretion system protein GspG C-terminal domain-containing protein n=5 Tax=Candidatus Woeseibacteriota TaxID=1752722 RepID=A0A0G0V0P4_9BACT|nr:MAG: hypothetical protein UT93_C0005G0004 [Candidatus Woesebacteria bacterium GW2011_GWF1_40_24]KKS16339.1 MAG: hypothetical protein UU74_C0044G0005 [Candidatus Woesebacteria bacterium GW2011_GWA1_41_7]OGM84737.1 MAG: hypothetical protein A2434_00620 [Candidatus Woesebacteria bacterium RIFOXYC1_FULL_41_14]